jgi:hypothetical protein
LAEADAALAGGAKRGVVAAMPAGEQVITGRSNQANRPAAPGPISPEILDLYRQAPPSPYGIEGQPSCAEPRLFTNALNAGANPAGRTVVPTAVGRGFHGTPVDACPACQYVANQLGATIPKIRPLWITASQATQCPK